jgi:hypothetical protein
MIFQMRSESAHAEALQKDVDLRRHLPRLVLGGDRNVRGGGAARGGMMTRVVILNLKFSAI